MKIIFNNDLYENNFWEVNAMFIMHLIAFALYSVMNLIFPIVLVGNLKKLRKLYSQNNVVYSMTNKNEHDFSGQNSAISSGG